MDRIHLVSSRTGEVKALLNRAGLRATSARIAVVRVLAAQMSPVSPGQICRLLENAEVDRATVYRTIDALFDRGTIHRAYSEGRTSFYELSDRCEREACHPHFRCRRCGVVTCLYGVEVAPPSHMPGGFVVERRKMTLSGLCPDCSGNRQTAD